MAHALREAIEATRKHNEGIVTQARGYVYVTIEGYHENGVILDLVSRGDWLVTGDSGRESHLRLFKPKE